MSLDVISNYSDKEYIFDAQELLKVRSGNDELTYRSNWPRYSVSGWLPGSDLEISIEYRKLPCDGRLFINWYSPETHLRGWILSANLNDARAVGVIKGKNLRGRIEMTPTVIDDQGRILAQSRKLTIELEGREAYFPTFAKAYDSHEADAFCQMVFDPSWDLDSLISKESLHAEFNTLSRLCDSSTGLPATDAGRGFATYEIWRQMIETVLNRSEFNENAIDLSDEEDRIGAVVLKLLKQLFPTKTIEAVRTYRSDEYPKFCARLQHFFFQQ